MAGWQVLDKSFEQGLALFAELKGLVQRWMKPRGLVAFERFDDHVKKALVLANSEARAVGSKYILTEHILLGIVAEGTASGAQLVKQIVPDIAAVRAAVMTHLRGKETKQITAESAPGEKTKQVIEFAIEEARSLGRPKIGTEHILLGLLRQEQATAAVVLASLGVTESGVRQVIQTAVHATGGTR